MIDFLLGVPGKLKTIADRLSSTWAAQLDTLATRLSATWAAKLDTLAADYTTAKAAYLDATISTRAKEDTPLLDIPIASGIVGSASKTSTGTLSGIGGLASASSIATTSYTQHVNYTGAGVLNFAALFKTDSTNADSMTMRVTIDGVVIDTQTTAANQYAVVVPAGAISNGAVALDQIPFKSSLIIESKRDSGGALGTAYWRYRKTA